jgi:hypothetical protein
MVLGKFGERSNMTQMDTNAQYILDYLVNNDGWTKNAVCGMLGNMQTESGIIPDTWQSGMIGNTSVGYGLVQWTPATTLINWCNSQNLDYTQMDSQLKRIQWEVDNGQQYYSPSQSFKQFTQSTDTAYNLGLDFLAHYERPADPNQPIRGTQAQHWFDTLTVGGSPPGGGGTGGGGGTTPPPSTKNNLVTLYLTGALPW